MEQLWIKINYIIIMPIPFTFYMSRLIPISLAMLLLAGCSHTVSTKEQSPASKPTETETAFSTPRDWRAYLYAWAAENGVLQDRTGCEQTIQTEGSYKEYIISDSTSLFETICFQAAYQTVYAYFLVTKTAPIEVTLVNFYREEQREMETIAGFTDFSNDRLTVFTKARGLGDCGIQAEYSLEGSRFVLEKTQEKDCDDSMFNDGDIVIDPNAWPVTYQRPSVK